MVTLLIVLGTIFLAVVALSIAVFVYLYFYMLKMTKRITDETLKGFEQDTKMFKTIKKVKLKCRRLIV